MDARPIGVFDSGIGGLTVLKELQKAMPNENFIYLADQAHLPYGNKSKKELIGITSTIMNYFLTKDVKLVVIACNTATANTIDALRKKYSLPIVGTIPAVKPAAENTKTGTIAVLSTPATAKSSALKKLIRQYCRGIKVLNIPCPDLVAQIEKGDLDSTKTKKLLEKYLKPVIDSNADHVVLGCTHYPLLKKQMQKILGRKVKIIDSGTAIAKRTKHILQRENIENKTRGKTIYQTTLT
ncbi:MAG: glutamate racemase [Candidatus Pacebacteria bacterium]|nr:glutamate racemase [Candidatus Paceibacterota bacterium]